MSSKRKATKPKGARKRQAPTEQIRQAVIKKGGVIEIEQWINGHRVAAVSYKVTGGGGPRGAVPNHYCEGHGLLKHLSDEQKALARRLCNNDPDRSDEEQTLDQLLSFASYHAGRKRFHARFTPYGHVMITRWDADNSHHVHQFHDAYVQGRVATWVGRVVGGDEVVDYYMEQRGDRMVIDLRTDTLPDGSSTRLYGKWSFSDGRRIEVDISGKLTCYNADGSVQEEFNHCSTFDLEPQTVCSPIMIVSVPKFSIWQPNAFYPNLQREQHKISYLAHDREFAQIPCIKQHGPAEFGYDVGVNYVDWTE